MIKALPILASSSENHELPAKPRQRRAKRTTNQFGFTLVELLVAISIIVILSSIAFVAFGTVQSRARDVRRKVDIDYITKIVEGSYNPSTNTYGTINEPIPSDPKNVDPYRYIVWNNATPPTGTIMTTTTLGVPITTAAISGLNYYYICVAMETTSGNTNCGVPVAAIITSVATDTYGTLTNGACYCQRYKQKF